MNSGNIPLRWSSFAHGAATGENEETQDWRTHWFALTPSGLSPRFRNPHSALAFRPGNGRVLQESFAPTGAASGAASHAIRRESFRTKACSGSAIPMLA